MILQQLHTRLRRSNLSDDELTRITDGQRKDYPQGIPQCGTDALRFTLCSYNYKGGNVLGTVLSSFCGNNLYVSLFISKYICCI